MPALEFGIRSNADVSGTNLDANSVGIAQVVVAKPDADACSKGGKRRRRTDESSCPGPSSSSSPQQNNPEVSGGDEQTGDDSGVGEQQDDLENMPTFAPVSESSCPEEHFPICVAPNLLENPSAPGTFDIIPWVGYNIPPTIEISEYSRFCASVPISEAARLFLSFFLFFFFFFSSFFLKISPKRLPFC